MQHLWLCASTSCSAWSPWLHHRCQGRETGTTGVTTTGITGLCLLFNELDVKRSKQWNQGYSKNEVRGTAMSLFAVRKSIVAVQLQKQLGQRSR